MSDPAKRASDDSASQTSVITTSHLRLPEVQRSADLCFPKISACSLQSAAAGDMGITYVL